MHVLVSWVKTTRLLRAFSTASILILCSAENSAFCSGVVTNASQAALVHAMAGGGLVTFGFNGTIVLTNRINVATNTILDATGQSVAISGKGAVPILSVAQGVSLALTNLTLENGLALGNEANALGQYEGLGGAIYNSGTVWAVDCIFTNNGAEGAEDSYPHAMGPLTPSYPGPPGLGGAIFNAGSLIASNCLFVTNWAQGARGPDGSIPGPEGGGYANGGAVCNSSNAVIVNCAFIANLSRGGAPGAEVDVMDDVPAGSGGDAAGGAIWNSAALSVTNSTFTGNACVATGAGNIPSSSNNPQAASPYPGAAGGNASGAGVISVSGSAFLAGTTFMGNWAQAGSGGTAGDGKSYYWGGPTPGGTGGLAGYSAGAGVCLSAGTLGVVNCTFFSNTIVAGSGGAGGVGGSGSAGPVPSAGDPGGNGANGGNAAGAAICVLGGLGAVTNVTCAGNAGTAGEFGLADTGGTNGMPGSLQGDSIAVVQGSLIVLNSILSCAPDGTNVFGGIVDAGYNLNSDATGALTNQSSFNGIDPDLGPIGNYGGPTQTIPLLAGSPAIDAADPASFPPTDQRGRARPVRPRS